MQRQRAPGKVPNHVAQFLVLQLPGLSDFLSSNFSLNSVTIWIFVLKEWSIGLIAYNFCSDELFKVKFKKTVNFECNFNSTPIRNERGKLAPIRRILSFRKKFGNTT
jgi:hypothetical protein